VAKRSERMLAKEADVTIGSATPLMSKRLVPFLRGLGNLLVVYGLGIGIQPVLH